MPDYARESPLTDYRKRLVVQKLATNVPKTHIAREIGVNVATIRRWLLKDPDLVEAVTEAKKDLRVRLEDHEQQLALGLIPSTPEVSYKALRAILDRFEAEDRHRAGETSAKGLNYVMMEICRTLYDMPEARARILEVYRRTRREHEEGHGGTCSAP